MPDYQPLVKIDARSMESLQIEASFFYKISANLPDLGLVEPKYYQVDSYFVLPAQFQASPKHYSIDSFYRDIKSYFSFRFPKLSFKEIVGIGRGEENSPIARIESFLADYKLTTLGPKERSYVFQEAKLWACSLYYFTDRKVNKLRKLLAAEEVNSKAVLELVEENRNRIVAIMQRWKEIKARILVYAPESRGDIGFIEEYIGLVMKDFILKQMDLLSANHLNDELKRPSTKQLQAFLRLLRWHSKKAGYLWVDDESEEEDRREFSFRRGVLKRSIWSALYIQTASQSLFKLRRQAGAMIAAAIAGFWAVLAELVISGSGTDFQSLGASGFIIITALVLAYVLKDRIKELGKSRFKSGLFGRVPDNQSNMFYNLGATLDKAIKVGTYSEKASYLTSDKLPEDIRTQLSRSVNVQENHLHTICYSKKISISQKTVRKLNLKIKAVYDFFRLNLSALMFYADENDDRCRIPTSNLSVAWTSIPKIYKVDLIIKVTGKAKQDIEPLYKHYQLVLSKQGIHTIDSVGVEEEEETID